MKNIFITYKRASFQHLVNRSEKVVIKMNNDKNHDIVTLLAYLYFIITQVVSLCINMMCIFNCCASRLMIAALATQVGKYENILLAIGENL